MLKLVTSISLRVITFENINGALEQFHTSKKVALVKKVESSSDSLILIKCLLNRIKALSTVVIDKKLNIFL